MACTILTTKHRTQVNSAIAGSAWAGTKRGHKQFFAGKGRNDLDIGDGLILQETGQGAVLYGWPTSRPKPNDIVHNTVFHQGSTPRSNIPYYSPFDVEWHWLRRDHGVVSNQDLRKIFGRKISSVMPQGRPGQITEKEFLAIIKLGKQLSP